MTGNPFKSAWLRHDRARDRAHELHAREKEFFDSKPYSPIVDIDPEGGEHIYKIKLTTPLPDRFSLDVSQVLEDLRHSLDHAFTAACRTLGPTDPKIIKRLYFPIAETEEKFTATVTSSNFKKVPAEIVALLRSFQPYGGGNNFLWALTSIAGMSKHRDLVGVDAVADNFMFLDHFTISTSGPAVMPMPLWDRANGEMIYFRSAPGAQVQGEPRLRFFITFGDVEVVRGQPVLAVLGQIGSIVQGVLRAMEAETTRLSSRL